jgi:hypothetical protein
MGDCRVMRESCVKEEEEDVKMVGNSRGGHA